MATQRKQARKEREDFLAAATAHVEVLLGEPRDWRAIERWLRWYEDQREEGEVFNAFTARVGTKAFEDEVRDLALPVEFGLDTMATFIDWT